jgi:methionyl-tRNA synthetase
LESLRIIALLLAAFMTSTSEKMWSQLKMEGTILEQNLNDTTTVWGGLTPGKKLEKPAPLFPRIDPSTISID